MEQNFQDILSQATALQKKRGIPLFLYMQRIMPDGIIQARQRVIDFKRKDGISKSLDILLYSPGGHADDAYRLIKLFRSNFDEVNIIVPFWAKSAATIFSLGASNLILDEFGELGPIDAQVYNVKEDVIGEDWSSALNTFASLKEIEDKALQNVANMFEKLSNNSDVTISRGHLFDALLNFSSGFYKPLLDKVNTSEIGEMSRILDVAAMYALRILVDYNNIPKDRIAAFLNFLTYECPEHGFVIDHGVLQRYLTNVTLSQPETVGQEVYSAIQNLSMAFMDYNLYDRESKKDYSVVEFLDDIISAGEKNEPPANGKKDTGSRGRPKQPRPKRVGTKPNRNPNQRKSAKG